MKGKPSFPGWLRLIISLVLLGFLAIKLDVNQLLIAFRNVRFDIVFIVLIIAFCLRIFAAYKWFILYRCTNKTVTLGESIRVSLVATFIGQFFPGAVGIEAMRVYGMAISTSDLAGSFTSVLVERLFGLLSLIIMVFIGLFLAQQELPVSFTNTAWFAFIILIIPSALLLHPASRNTIERCLPEFVVRRIEEKLAKLYACIDLYKKQPLQLVISLFLAVFFQILRVILCFFAALSLGVEVSILPLFVFVPIIVFVTLLPISISGLGVREAGFVYFFSTYGIMDAQSAFALSIIIFVVDMITTIPGAYFYVKNRL